MYSGNWCQISVAIKVLEEAGGQGDQVAASSRENRDIDPSKSVCANK